MKKRVISTFILMGTCLFAIAQQKQTTVSNQASEAEVLNSTQSKQSVTRDTEIKSKQRQINKTANTPDQLQKAAAIERDFEIKIDARRKSKQMTQAEKDNIIKQYEQQKQKYLIDLLGKENYELYKTGKTAN
jgi:hypothetical protein